MEEAMRRRLEQLLRMTEQGHYGVKLQQAAAEYAPIPPGNELQIKMLRDYYIDAWALGPATTSFINTLSQEIIGLYRDAREIDSPECQHFVDCMTKDYPGIPDTKVFLRMESLHQASLAYDVRDRSNPILDWKAKAGLYEAGSEFSGRLIGWLMLLWKAGRKQTVNPNALTSLFGVQVTELKRLSDLENGMFSGLLSVLDSKLRNAIAHHELWIDDQRQIINYTYKGDSYQLGVKEFNHRLAHYTHLAQVYITTLAAIGVIESRVHSDVMQLPTHLINEYFRLPSQRA